MGSNSIVHVLEGRTQSFMIQMIFVIFIGLLRVKQKSYLFFRSLENGKLLIKPILSKAKR